MKRFICALSVVVTLVAGVSVDAGEGCCAAGKAAAGVKADKSAACAETFAKLNLTEDQKTKIAALKADCDKTGCTETSRAKMQAGLKEILTPEQFAQCKTECDKAGKGGCPMMKSEAKPDSKS